MKKAPTVPQTLTGQDFTILFEKMEELKATHSEIWSVASNSQPEIDQIKAIVEACNPQAPFTTWTRS